MPNPIIPWLETIGSILLALVGVALGRWCSRLRGHWWMIGYFSPLLLIFFMGLPNWVPEMSFIPPSSWLTAGRNKYLFAGIAATWLLTTPLSRLPRIQTRRLIAALMISAVFATSVIAFLSPALVRHRLQALTTRIDSNGICRQSTPYNCGPASAVTALRRLGVNADEGPLAILAHTSPINGTPPDILAETLREQFGKEGITAQYRFFKKVEEMRGIGEVLAIIKLTALLDHYVAVLEVTDKEITVGDPFDGRATYTHEEFNQKWRHCGVVVNRKR